MRTVGKNRTGLGGRQPQSREAGRPRAPQAGTPGKRAPSQTEGSLVGGLRISKGRESKKSNLSNCKNKPTQEYGKKKRVLQEETRGKRGGPFTIKGPQRPQLCASRKAGEK